MARGTLGLTVLTMSLVALALMGGGLSARADDASESRLTPETREARFGVAVIDVGRVFKNHARFKQKMELMKQDLLDIEGRYKLERAQIQVFVDRLKTLARDSEDYPKLEEDIASRQSKLQTDIALQKKRFMMQEATIYAQTYADIKAAVEAYAREEGIRLVMRYDSNPIDETDPNSIMKGVNRNIVFQDGIDITDEIMRRVNTNSDAASEQ